MPRVSVEDVGWVYRSKIEFSDIIDCVLLWLLGLTLALLVEAEGSPGPRPGKRKLPKSRSST